MKKLFFFRSHSSTSGNSNQFSPTSADKQVSWESKTDHVNTSRTNKHDSNEVCGNAPCLKRSLSLSSGSLHESAKGLRNHGDVSGSPCNYSHRSSGHQILRSRALTPERPSREAYFNPAVIKRAQSLEKSDCFAFNEEYDPSDNASHCSSNVSSKVLDRFVDGEQQIEKSKSKTNASSRNQFENGCVKKPPRKQFSVPVSLDARRQKPRSQSFREIKSSQIQLPSREWIDSGVGNESPRKLAKHVIERLSQSQLLPKESEPDSPITIEDVYSRSFSSRSPAYTDEVSPKNYTRDWHNVTSDGSQEEYFQEFFERDSSSADKNTDGENTISVADVDLELFRRFKEAEERAVILSEELGQENFRGISVPVLIQRIRNLTEEKANMAHEVSAIYRERIAQKALFMEEIRVAKVEQDAQIRRLEMEKQEMQFALEKELDRRSSDWSLKVEKYQAEEHRLRERVRELAEQNVRLQREISSFAESETEANNKITDSEKQLQDLSLQVTDAREETSYLQKSLSEALEKCRAAEEELGFIRRNYEEKAIECKDMHHSISRLQRTCNDQEKTIAGLRGLCDELEKKLSHENYDFGITKLQVEHMRLTGIEHDLRTELESCKHEIDTLRHENIDLLNRLKDNGKDVAISSLKLDRELNNRVSCLQNQALPLLSESIQLGKKLIECAKTSCDFPTNKGSVSCPGFDAQALIEWEVKLQGLERASENFASSLHTMSRIVDEKSSTLQEMLKPVGVESQTNGSSDVSNKQDDHKHENIVRSELKAETLLTSLLREKLYSKDQEVEQLQAEVAAAVRGNDILKCEVQNTMDNFSCLKHQMKDIELQMMKKDEVINRLQGDLQECKKELAILKGILPKVSEERDKMWEQVKQYSEKNMLLNAEINMLKKKIEALDEDILLKEGQITLLKDAIGKPFDLLSPDSPGNFF